MLQYRCFGHNLTANHLFSRVLGIEGPVVYEIQNILLGVCFSTVVSQKLF